MRELEPLEAPLSGTHLIEASAGTGKTYTITTLFLRLLVERELPVDRILVVTFTRAATAELRARVRRRLRQALAVVEGGIPPSEDPTLGALVSTWRDRKRARTLLLDALRSVDAAAVFTIHGFCQRVLQEYAFESGARFDLELVANERPLVNQVLCDFWADECSRAPAQIVRHMLATGTTPEALFQLAQHAIEDPSIEVVPPYEPRGDDEPALAAIAQWKRAHVHASELWWAHRDALLTLLSRSPDLDHSRYRPRSVWGQWSRQLDRQFEEMSTGPEPLPDAFVRFTPAALAQATRKGRATPTHPFFDAAEALQDAYVATRPHVDGWIRAFRRRMVDRVRAAAIAAKEQSRVQAYPDLLHRLSDALREASSGPELARRIRERYPAALIDEFQDTDPVQYHIFATVHGGQPDAGLFLIGDPKQAIYGFRGADIFAYLRAREDAEDPRTLTRNHRSDPSLIAATNHLFGRHPRPFLFDEIGFAQARPAPGASDHLQHPEGADPADTAALRLCFVRRNEDNAWRGQLRYPFVERTYPHLVAAEVSRILSSGALLDDRPLRPGDLAVLVRTNKQAQQVHAALQRLRIPAALQGDASVLDSAEARDMLALVRALADPADPSALRAALATRALGVDGVGLVALQKDEDAWERWSERFHRYHGLWTERSFLLAFRQLLAERDVAARLLGQLGGERALTNLLHLSELLQDMCTERRLGPVGALHWLESATADRDARASLGTDADQMRLESDSGAVELVTVHRAKGLQYPIVLCTHLHSTWTPRTPWLRFHDPDDDWVLKLDVGSDEIEEHEHSARREDLADALRLVYVALTRARHACVVMWGGFSGHDRSGLGWLLHGAPVADQADEVPALAARIGAMADPALLADLQDLAETSSGTISVRELGTRRGVPRQPAADAPPELAARRPRRAVPAAWRVSSFSGIAQGAPRAAEVLDGVDYDAAPATPIALYLAGDEAELDPGPKVPLAEFPRGAAAGTLLHGILEELDFADPDDTTWDAAIADALAGSGVAGAEWTPALRAALRQVAGVPLGPGEAALRDLARADRVDELAFVFPVRASLTPSSLAAPFRDHGATALVRDYAARLEGLGFAPLTGFLKGFIDLLFRHDGRYWVVDYKSNHLGDHAGAYGPEALGLAMLHHDYVLQVHLYCVAVHRFLAARVRDYDYDTHFGGARYLFLRGMAPAHGAGHGVYADRPPRVLIEALSRQVFGS